MSEKIKQQIKARHNSLFKRIISDIRQFFKKPEEDIFALEPDWDHLSEYYFNTPEHAPMDPRTKAELKMRLMERQEQQKSTQRNVEMLWRAQILTAFTTLLSFVSVTIAVIAVFKK